MRIFKEILFYILLVPVTAMYVLGYILYVLSRYLQGVSFLLLYAKHSAIECFIDYKPSYNLKDLFK